MRIIDGPDHPERKAYAELIAATHDDGGWPKPDAAFRSELVAYRRAWAQSRSTEPPYRYASAKLSDLDESLRSSIDAALATLPDLTGKHEAVIREVLSSTEYRDSYRNSLPGQSIDSTADALRGWGGVCLFGPVGTGKTFALWALAGELQSRGIPVKTIAAVTLVNALRSSFEKDAKETAAEIIDRLSSVPVLAIDDIDKVKASEFVLASLFELINNRVDDGLPVCLTSNSNPAQLLAHLQGFGTFAEAVVDRLKCCTPTWIQCSGKSRRGQHAA